MRIPQTVSLPLCPLIITPIVTPIHIYHLPHFSISTYFFNLPISPPPPPPLPPPPSHQQTQTLPLIRRKTIPEVAQKSDVQEPPETEPVQEEVV